MNKQTNSSPLVSIIVNCFNGEKYLKKTLSSILEQTYQNWEVIFWDNQSSDNSKKYFMNSKIKDLNIFILKDIHPYTRQEMEPLTIAVEKSLLF